jgi:hypothetical protein
LDNLSVYEDWTKLEFLLVMVTDDETWVYSYEKEKATTPVEESAISKLQKRQVC